MLILTDILIILLIILVVVLFILNFEELFLYNKNVFKCIIFVVSICSINYIFNN